MKKEDAKELALITAIILAEDIFKGSVFQTFDKAYEVAKEFIKEYPTDTIWDHRQEYDYDETIIKFTNKYLKTTTT